MMERQTRRFFTLFLLFPLFLLTFHSSALCEGADDVMWCESFVVLDDPAYFFLDEAEEMDTTAEDSITYDEAATIAEGMSLTSTSAGNTPLPVITSIGKSNVKINGYRSDNKLLEYTIPQERLAADPAFLALMVEAEKYIGYPYVYGESNPQRGFDCSGFVSWVFIHSGVCDTGRRGANGLFSLCEVVPENEIRPGDLVFFRGTMGANVEGITHVGIYVGDNMMIHAGDPVGFADLSVQKWQTRLDCYGRLPID